MSTTWHGVQHMSYVSTSYGTQLIVIISMLDFDQHEFVQSKILSNRDKYHAELELRQI